MNTEAVLDDLRSRIEAGYPLLFLQTWEEERWENQLAALTLEIGRGLVTWTITSGLQPPPIGAADVEPSAWHLLTQLGEYPPGHVFLVKDFHAWIKDPVVVRRLRDVLNELIANQKTLVFLGPVAEIPFDLAKDAVRIELPLPNYEDLRPEFDAVISERLAAGEPELPLNDEEQDKLIKAVMGLSTQEARKAWRRALHGRSELEESVFTTLISEKRTLASGSDLLEFYDLEEGIGDIGGLDALKDWMARRAEAYTPRAREQGIPLPKGMLLLGVQGCGKSLTARATARLLAFPLIRLDIANLLGSARGESEKNMRNSLALVESIAPAVLWLDEIEKGFAGVETDGSGGGDATMTRLVGTFLTWMSEIQKPIFVIATANSVQNLPPEMLRRGRFDELFFVDLPNFEERKHILGIHLKKRGWKPEQFDVEDLAARSDGFSGAELEQVVITAMIDAFGQGHIMQNDDLERAWRSTVPLSVTMEDKIFALRNWAQDRCRRSTSDSRVTSMLESEARDEALKIPDDDEGETALPPWAQLAHSGQLKAALVEFVRSDGDVLFPDLVKALGEYMEVGGDQGLAARANPNTVLWAGMSQPLCELICELVSSKRIYIHPADVERYKSVQKGLRLPVIKEPTDDRLPRASWLPSSLRCAPHPVHAARLARIGRMKLGGG
jgi:hypothetical protein